MYGIGIYIESIIMRPGSSSIRQSSTQESPNTDFEIDKLLGKGTFGTVFLVKTILHRPVGRVRDVMWP